MGNASALVECDRQFRAEDQIDQGYSDEVKRECLELDINGIGLRAIAGVKRVHHTSRGLGGKTCRRSSLAGCSAAKGRSQR